MIDIPTRQMFAEVCNQYNLTGMSIEIGVAQGYFSCQFVERWKGKIHYAVDSWYQEGSGESVADGNVRYLEALRNLEKYSNIIPMRMKSIEAANLCEDNTFNFIYIDALHDEKSVEADIRAWMPKLCKRGILAGHDECFPGVQAALKNVLHGSYFKTRDKEIHPDKCFENSWYILRGIE